MLERLEDIYLNIFRYLLIIGASIAVLVGVINLLISLSLIFIIVHQGAFAMNLYHLAILFHHK